MILRNNKACAGWGNAGGGATQALMPLLLGAIVMFGVEQTMGWRTYNIRCKHNACMILRNNKACANCTNQ
jgi:nitrate/nitrite transporter NarK